MTDKQRYILLAFAILAATGLTVFGFINGTQWASFVGGILTGGVGQNVLQNRTTP